MPTEWLTSKYSDDEETLAELSGHDYTRQAQYITFYTDKDGDKHGITLFKIREKKEIFKLLIRDKIYGRGLGFGGIEELFEPQVWTNYSIIQQKEMLDIAALMLLQTSDSTYTTKNKINDLEKGQILTHEQNAPITQVAITPVNYELFEKSVNIWQQNARVTGAATDPQLGIDPTSGTPFKLQDLVVSQGQDLHKYRQGKISTFMEEVYRDWILQYLVNDMIKGNKWLEELSLDEMQQVAETVATNETTRWVDEMVISENKMVPQTVSDQYKQNVIESFMKGGNKKFVTIVQGELKNVPINVEVILLVNKKTLIRSQINL